MTKKPLSISLSILACLFLAVLPVAAEGGPDNGPGLFQDLYQAILEWIAPPDELDDLVSPPPIPPEVSITIPANQPEIGTMIPPGG